MGHEETTPAMSDAVKLLPPDIIGNTENTAAF